MSYESVVKREIKRYIASPLAWIVSFIFPLIMCIIICLIFNKATPTNLPIGVYDADNSQISRLIVRNLETLQSCHVKYRTTSLEDGHQLLIEGKIYGFIVIPKNFQRDIYRMSQPKLVYYYNNQRILIGGIITKDVTALAQSLIVGLDAKMKSKKGIPFEEAVKQSNLINVVEHIRSNPYFNYMYLISLTAFGHIMQIAISMMSVWAIGTEFKYGTTKEWLKEADDSIIIAFLGKITPYFVIIMILFGIIDQLYYGIFGAPYVGNIPIGFLCTLLFTSACLSLGIIFMSVNGNFRLGLSFCAFYVAIGFALAGVTFPVMAMPKFVQAYTSIMPLNYWVQVMLDQSLRNIPYIYDFKFLIPLLIIIFVGHIALVRLKVLAKNGTRWDQ